MVSLLSARLPFYILTILVASAPTTNYGPPPGITFDRFVRACVVVKTLTESFQRYVRSIQSHSLFLISSSADTDRDGWVQLSYEQFMSVSLFFLDFMFARLKNLLDDAFSAMSV